MYLCNKEIYHIFKTCCIIFVLFSTHCHLYSNIYPTRCNVTQFILSGNCSTCLGWYHHPSSGAHTTVQVSTASCICHTITAICRYRGRVGTGLSVLWVAYAKINCVTSHLVGYILEHYYDARTHKR